MSISWQRTSPDITQAIGSDRAASNSHSAPIRHFGPDRILRKRRRHVPKTPVTRRVRCYSDKGSYFRTQRLLWVFWGVVLWCLKLEGQELGHSDRERIFGAKPEFRRKRAHGTPPERCGPSSLLSNTGIHVISLWSAISSFFLQVLGDFLTRMH